MLVQDTLTGAVHEIPQSQLYEADYAESPEQMAEGQILYDGLGNPVGFSFLKAFRKACPVRFKACPVHVALADTWGRSPDPGGPAGASRCNKQVGRRLLRRGRARPANARAANARADLATAARMDSPPIALPGQEGASHVFAMRLLARSKGFGARGGRTGATCAGSRCPTSRPAGARGRGTAICSPPPALMQSPVSESSLCAGA